jgi:hypothetical protein
MAHKKLNVISSVRMILQAAATAIAHGMVTKHPKGGGICIKDLKNKASQLTKKVMSTKEFIAALRTWFDMKLAKYNNKALHLTGKGLAEIQKFAIPAPA